MADQSIVMKLSLIDTASPQLADFMKQLEQMKSMVASVNTALGTLDTRMNSIGASADKAATGFDRAATSIAGMGSAATGTDAAVSTMASKMAELVVILRDFATSANGASRGINGVNASMVEAGAAASGFEGKLHSLGSTIKSVGELWAAAKIGKGMEESVVKASELQDSQVRAKNAGGPELDSAIKAAIVQAQKNVPQMDATELTKIGLDIYDASGKVSDVSKMADLAKSLYVMKKSDATGSFGDADAMKFFKFLDDRGSFMDDSKLQADTEVAVKASIGTQNRVGPMVMQMFIKTLANGLGKSMSTEGLYDSIPLIESYGPSVAATMINAMQRTVSGSQIKKELIPNWDKLDLVSPDGKSMKHYDEFRDNPLGYQRKYVNPALQKQGVDTTDDTQMAMAATKLYGTQKGQEGAFAGIGKLEQFEKQTEVIKKASDQNQAYEEITKTASAANDAFKTSMTNLEQTVGGALLPMLTEVVGWITKFVNMINDGLKGDQLSTEIAIIGLSLTGLGLAIKGAAALFGLIAPAAAVAAEGAAVPLAALATRTPIWGAAAALGFVGAFTVGFVFGTAIRNFEVFGTTLQDIAGRVVIALIGQFDRFVNYVSNFVLGAIEKTLTAAGNAAASVGMSDTAGSLQNGSASIAAMRAGLNKGYKERDDNRASYSAWSAAVGEQTVAEQNNAAGAKAAPAAPVAPWSGGKSDPSKYPKFLTDPAAKKSGGKGRDPDQIAANSESENARFEKEKLAIELKAIEDLYKDHEIGIEAYFSKKADAIKADSAAQVAALEREKAILEKSPAKNADKINKVDHDIELAGMKEKQSLMDLEVQKKKALLDLNKEGLTVEEKLQSITQSASKAKIAMLDDEYQKKRKIFEINGMIAQASELDDLHAREVAKVRYDDQMKQISLVGNMEKTTEMAAQALVKSGNATSSEANQAIIEAKRSQGEQELKILATMKDQSEIYGDPTVLENIKQMTIAAQGLADTLDEGAQKFKAEMQSSIEGALNDMMSGKFSFKKFFAGIVSDLNKSTAKALSESITNGLTGQGGLLSGFMKDGGNFITNLFGGGSKTSSLGGGQNSLASMFGSIFGPSKAGASTSAGGGSDDWASNTGEGAGGPLGAASSAASDALKSMTKDGVKATTDGLVKQVSQQAIGDSANQMATTALQSLSAAAQQASAALQQIGGGGGGAGGSGSLGGISSLFGGSGSGGDAMSNIAQGMGSSSGGGGIMSGIGTFFSSMLSFDVGADSIPRDMIAKIHAGEMILPADTAERVRSGTVGSGSGGVGDVHQHITFNMPPGGYDKRTQSQIGSALGQVMQKHMQRNN